MLLAAALMWSMHRWWPIVRLLAAPWTRIGTLPIAAGILVAAAAIAQFSRSRTTLNPLEPSRASSLVTTGIFTFSRNPMYLGLVLLLTGWALWLGSASPWFVPPLFAILLYRVQIVPEERALAVLFGEAYVAYRHRVRRWIGRSG